MSKTIPIRCYTEDLQRIELLRRKLTINRQGKRVNFPQTINWLLDLAEQVEKRADDNPARQDRG